MPSETIDSSGNINVTWDADGASLFFSRSTNAAATFSVAVSIPTSPSPSLQKIAVGSDGNSRLLWDRSDGAGTVWSIDNNSNVLSYGSVSGPYPGWRAQSIASGADGYTRQLWSTTTGNVGLRLLQGTGNSYVNAFSYGPY